MDKYFDNTPLVRVIYKWKWHIITITIVAAILGAIFSGSKFITPLYKSEAILYPSNVSAYSDETFSEQMLQILQSNEIMDSVVNNFNLLEHYNISKDYIYWRTALIDEYNDRVTITKTPYDAVSIKVMDKDPQYACDMVNDIIRLYDYKVGTLHKIKRLEVVNMYKRQLTEKKHYIDSLRNRLTEIATEYGVVSVDEQSREIAKGYLKTADKGNINNDGVEVLKGNMEKYASEVTILNELIRAESVAYSNTKLDYEQELRFYNADMTFSNVISEPFVADRKAFPTRWIIVAISALSACVLSMVVVFVIENRKSLFKQ